MVRLHALESVNKQPTTSEVKSLPLGLDGSLHVAARPEGVVHGAPRVLMVSSVVCGSILTDHETRRCTREGQIDHAVFVDSRLDGVGVGFFVKRNAQVVSAKGKHALVEHEVGQRIRAPIMRTVTLEVVDLGVELSSGMDAPIEQGKTPLTSVTKKKERKQKKQTDNPYTMLL